MTPLQAPHVEYALIAPLLIVSAGALLGTLLEAVVARRARFASQVFVSFVTIAAALVDSIWVYRHLKPLGELGRGQLSTEGAVAVDGPGVLTWAMLSVFALMSVAL